MFDVWLDETWDSIGIRQLEEEMLKVQGVANTIYNEAVPAMGVIVSPLYLCEAIPEEIDQLIANFLGVKVEDRIIPKVEMIE